jgi:hypothetical protein
MADWGDAKVKTLLKSMRDCCALFWKRRTAAGKRDTHDVWMRVFHVSAALRDFDIGRIEIECDMSLEEVMKLSDETVTFAGVEADSYAGVLILIAIELLSRMDDISSGDEAEGYRYLDEQRVAENWAAVSQRLAPNVPSQKQFDELAELVEQELKARPPEKTYHKVYKPRQPVRPAKARRRLTLYRLPARALRRGRAIDALEFVPGEPVDRHVTKIGGLPYRPARMRWPTGEDGAPLSFVAQICFAGSKDLCGNLPGDVLLILAASHDHAISVNGELFFEWYPLGLDRLIEAKDVPQGAWPIAPCYAFVRRQPESGPGYKGSALGHEGAKIGGEPVWLGLDQPTEGRFLAALARPGMLQRSALPRGWQRTQATDTYDRTHEFRPGDGGLFNFFHAGRGKVNFTFQCY